MTNFMVKCPYQCSEIQYSMFGNKLWKFEVFTHTMTIRIIKLLKSKLETWLQLWTCILKLWLFSITSINLQTTLFSWEQIFRHVDVNRGAFGLWSISLCSGPATFPSLAVIQMVNQQNRPLIHWATLTVQSSSHHSSLTHCFPLLSPKREKKSIYFEKGDGEERRRAGCGTLNL